MSHLTIDDIRRAVEHECTGLDPDGDVLPTLLYRNADDERMVLGMAIDNEAADEMAVYMTAALMVDEAVEAFYSSFCWSVTETRPEVVAEANRTGDWSGVMPAQHPDRVEQAMIAHYTPDGAGFHFAPVIRSTDAPPRLGEWQEDSFLKLSGRIARSLEAGLKMSATLPEVIRLVYRAARAEGGEAREGAIRGTIGAIRGDG